MKDVLYIRVTADLKQFVEQQAANLGMTVNAYVVMVMQQHKKEVINEH